MIRIDWLNWGGAGLPVRDASLGNVKTLVHEIDGRLDEPTIRFGNADHLTGDTVETIECVISYRTLFVNSLSRV